MSFGLLGEHLSHSYSQIIHNMIGAYSYDMYEVAPEDLEDFIENGDFSGLNVTMPYKETVMPLIQVDPLAKKLGAVNTIYHKDGVLRGANTDFFGFMYLLSLNKIDLTNKKVLILGTGGASKIVQATAHACEAKDVFVASRQKSKQYVSYKTLPLDVDIIVNATPVGTYPNVTERIVDLKPFTKLEAVVDLNYNPSKSDLLLQAEKRGIKFANGLSMLVAQATKAGQYFVGMDFLQYNKQILRNLEAMTLNIVIVGMPSSGKTTIGTAVAKLTDRKFVDLDEEVVKRAGMPIPEIFDKYGEKHFRNLETEVIKDFGKEKNLVIATGGGTIIKEENRDAIRCNSVVVELKRDFSLLSTDGRPVSQAAESMDALYNERKEFYDLAKDVSVENNDTVENIANKVLDKIGDYYENEDFNK